MTSAPGLTNPVVTIVPGNYKRLQAVFAKPVDYNSVVTLTYQQQTGVPRPVSILATSAYLGSTNVTLALPNFTGVTGWDDSWGPLVSAASQWHLTATGGNFATTFCSEGVRLVSAAVSGAN